MTDKRYTTLENLLFYVMSGVNIRIEDRISAGYNTYELINHGEILGHWNIVDNSLWDVVIFGYSEPFSFEKIYRTNKLMGVILFNNGNHKIIVKLKNRGFSKKRYYEDLKKFLFNYKKCNGITGEYFNFQE